MFGLDQNPNYGILNKEKNVTDTDGRGLRGIQSMSLPGHIHTQ